MSWLKSVVTGAVLFGLGRSAFADQIWIGEKPDNAYPVPNVTITGPKGDELQYMTAEDNPAHTPFSHLQQININGETNFNSAEDAYAKKDYDSAITAYQTVLQNSTKDWMKTRAALRLISVGKLKSRYDAEVAAYVALLAKDPATAAQNKPSEPQAGSQYLDAALASISKGLDDPKLQNTEKSTLLNLQLQIEQVKGDTAGVQSTLKQLVALGGGTDEMKATLKLADANVSYQSKQYSQAIADIEQNRSLFTDPQQQVDALFVLAQSKFAVDGEKTETDVLKDIALAYVRVVTFGSQLPDRPHVAESLYQAGVVEEKLKDNAAALQLYGTLAHDRAFDSSPFKAKADAAIARLGAAPK